MGESVSGDTAKKGEKSSLKSLLGKSCTTGPAISLFSYVTCSAFLIAVYAGSAASGLAILSFLGQSFPIFTIAGPIVMLLASLAYWTWRPYVSQEHIMFSIAFNMAAFAFMTWLFIAVIDPYVIHPAAAPILGGHG